MVARVIRYPGTYFGPVPGAVPGGVPEPRFELKNVEFPRFRIGLIALEHCRKKDDATKDTADIQTFINTAEIDVSKYVEPPKV